jgi:hypothetical protein
MVMMLMSHQTYLVNMWQIWSGISDGNPYPWPFFSAEKADALLGVALSLDIVRIQGTSHEEF